MMNKGNGLSIFFIVFGILVAIYFFTLGWYIIGGAGCGLIWAGVSHLNSMKVEIVNSEILEDENKRIIKFLIHNVSNKNGNVNIYVNIIKDNQIIDSMISNTLYLNSMSQGVAIVDITKFNNDKEKINYNITKIECKKQ